MALATTLLVQLNDNRPIEEARAIVRAEATALGVEWWDEKQCAAATGQASG